MAWKFRTHLAKLRVERGIERMDLVRKAGLSYATVLSWENDLIQSIDANKLKPVMELLQCSDLNEMIEFVSIEE
jgi:DNA-binding Xre family transcriptional regulator